MDQTVGRLVLGGANCRHIPTRARELAGAAAECATACRWALWATTRLARGTLDRPPMTRAEVSLS
ncbi:hypothetical protein SAY86_008976 [Trapa natans]|uniref:Uncharacterized protein n=1 Tax=Trapa natans TaxID=22666 RepID=A0AAN7KF03_TRANT|nr:hypothetical protein SAY86_008976 [Trapa natans]